MKPSPNLLPSPLNSLLACALVALAAGPLCAQTGLTPTPGQPPSAGYKEATPRLSDSSISRSDRKFLEHAAKSGVKEVALSQAVLANLSNPDARAFAEMMIKDHKVAHEELTALAAKKAVELPGEIVKLPEKWTTKSADLDHDYMKEMLKDHEDAVALFEKGTKADDADIAAFATKTLPTLKQHLQLARGDKSAVHNAH